MSDKNTNEPKITFHHQPGGDQSLGELITELARNADRISIATAFLREEGLELLKKFIDKIEIRVICGIDGQLSDVKALAKITRIPNSKMKGMVYKNLMGVKMFHSKLYIFEKGKETEVIIGSSNFTEPGTSQNEEINIYLKRKNTDEFVTSAMNYFLDLWNNRSDEVNTFLSNNKYEMNKFGGAEFDKKEKIPWKFSTKGEKPFIKDINEIKKTFFSKGQITIPVEYNSIIEKRNFFTKGNSNKGWKVYISWNKKVLDGELMTGMIKKKRNYRIYLCNAKSIGLNKIFSRIEYIEIVLNLDDQEIHISKLK
ncbi:MAG: phospholipase D family protein [Candidatus Marinimicrobia bacterium]|nr:phospholipase D family protein [Candidatus Neomarinimicrobiota bacterium]